MVDFEYGSLLSEAGHGFDSEDDVGDGAAAGEVGDGEIEALEDGAGDGEASKLFEGFVEEVAGVEVGSNEDIGLAGDGRGGEFFGGDGGVQGGIELHFAVDEEVGFDRRCVIGKRMVAAGGAVVGWR